MLAGMSKVGYIKERSCVINGQRREEAVIITCCLHHGILTSLDDGPRCPAGGDEWIHCCLSLPFSSPDTQGAAVGSDTSLSMDLGDGISIEAGPSSHSLSAPSTCGSGSLTQVCFSITGPPSNLVASGLTADCVIAPPAEWLDGQGDYAVRPGRRLHRSLKRPRQFESPVRPVPGDRRKKKRGNTSPHNSSNNLLIHKENNNNGLVSSLHDSQSVKNVELPGSAHNVFFRIAECC